MTDHVTELAGPFRWNLVHWLNAYIDVFSEPRAESVADARLDRWCERYRGNDLYPHLLPRFLDYLERGDFRQVAKNVDQREPVHDRAVCGDDEVGASSLNLVEHRQPAPARAPIIAQDANVTGSIANERKLAGREVRHDDFTGLSRRHDGAFGIDDLDDDVLGRNMHSAFRKLVRDR